GVGPGALLGSHRVVVRFEVGGTVSLDDGDTRAEDLRVRRPGNALDARAHELRAFAELLHGHGLVVRLDGLAFLLTASGEGSSGDTSGEAAVERAAAAQAIARVEAAVERAAAMTALPEEMAAAGLPNAIGRYARCTTQRE